MASAAVAANKRDRACSVVAGDFFFGLCSLPLRWSCAWPRPVPVPLPLPVFLMCAYVYAYAYSYAGCKIRFIPIFSDSALIRLVCSAFIAFIDCKVAFYLRFDSILSLLLRQRQRRSITLTFSDWIFEFLPIRCVWRGRFAFPFRCLLRAFFPSCIQRITVLNSESCSHRAQSRA